LHVHVHVHLSPWGALQDSDLTPLELLELGAPAVRYLRAFTNQCWLPVRRGQENAAAVAAAARARQHCSWYSCTLAAAPVLPAWARYLLCCIARRRLQWLAAAMTWSAPPLAAPLCLLRLQDTAAPIAMFDNSWAVALVTIWNDLTVPSNGL
jgi:hypothetical protein